MDKKKVIITGGAGFVGSQLGYRLNKEGYEVILIDNLFSGKRDNLIINGETFGKFIEKDIRDDDLAEYFKDAYCVFHFAGISGLPVCQSRPGLAVSVNTAGTANVLEAARKANVRRVVFSSTSAIYENNEEFPCKEEDKVNPDIIYSVSKLTAEKICHSFRKLYDMDIVILRYFNVYGPNQGTKKPMPFTVYVIDELLNNRTPTFYSDGNQKRDYVHIDDVNEMNILCMNRPEAVGKMFNVASEKTYSVNEIFRIISNLLNSQVTPEYEDPKKFWDKYPELFVSNHPLKERILIKEVNKYALGSKDKAYEKLGWAPKVSMEEGLSKIIDDEKLKKDSGENARSF